MKDHNTLLILILVDIQKNYGGIRMKQKQEKMLDFVMLVCSGGLGTYFLFSIKTPDLILLGLSMCLFMIFFFILFLK